MWVKIVNKLVTSLILAALPLVAIADGHEAIEKEILSLEATFNDAYGENDLDTYFGMYADDATLIFYGARHTLADYDEEWRATVADGGRVDENEMSDMRIQVMPGGTVAVATYVLETLSHTPDGEAERARAYETDVWQKREDGWKIISMHYSVID